MNACDGGDDLSGLKVLSLEEEEVLVRLKAVAERMRSRNAALGLAVLKEAIVESGGVPVPGDPPEGTAAFYWGPVGFMLSSTAGPEPGIDVEFLA